MSRAAARRLGQTLDRLDGVHGAHDGVAAWARRRRAASEEGDALIAQRITLVDADDGRRQSCNIVGAGEDRPRQWIFRAGSGDAIGVAAPLPQHPQEVPVELDRGRERLAISIERNVRTQRIEPGDQIDVALAQQPSPWPTRDCPTTLTAITIRSGSMPSGSALAWTWCRNQSFRPPNSPISPTPTPRSIAEVDEDDRTLMGNIRLNAR